MAHQGDKTMKPTSLLLLMALSGASFGFAQPAPPQTPSLHVWHQSQTTDAAHTFTFTRLTLTGKFVTSAPGQILNPPTLALDCIPGKGAHLAKSKFLAGNLLVGTNLKIIYVEPEEIHGTSYDQKVVVQYRTDDAKDEERDNWSLGTDKTSASIPKDSLKKILRARSVAITVDDEHEAPVAMQFDMPDPAQVEEACNVDEHK
jgi:hypothetical protein